MNPSKQSTHRSCQASYYDNPDYNNNASWWHQPQQWVLNSSVKEAKQLLGFQSFVSFRYERLEGKNVP